MIFFLDPQQFFDSLNKNEESRYSYQLLSQILERLSKHLILNLLIMMNSFGTCTIQLILKTGTFSTPLLFEQKRITLEKFKVYFPDFMESARQELAQISASNRAT